MIISYKGHKSIKLNDGKVSVIGTNNQTVFQDIIDGLQGLNDKMHLLDSDFNELEIEHNIDFDSGILFSHELFSKYEKKIINSVIENMNYEDKSKLNNSIQQLYTILQQQLFLTDLPLNVTYDGNLKRFISYCHLQLDDSGISSVYDIIISDLKIHLECELPSVLCFSNLNNYLGKNEFKHLLDEIQLIGKPLLLVEFTEKNKRELFGNSEFLFIDKDFIDWKM